MKLRINSTNFVLLISLIVAAIAVYGGTAQAQGYYPYGVSELGSYINPVLNNEGDVGAFGYTVYGTPALYIYSNGTWEDTGYTGTQELYPVAMNDLDSIALNADNHAAYLFVNAYEDPFFLGMSSLGNFEGYAQTFDVSAFDSSYYGTAVGESATGGNGDTHAFCYSMERITDLGVLYTDTNGHGYSSARAINDNGDIVGLSTASTGHQDLFLYRNGVMTDITPVTLDKGLNFVPVSINNSDQILGTTNTGHCLIIDGDTVLDTTPAGYNGAVLGSMNSSGQFVVMYNDLNGSSVPCVYSNGTTVPLQPLVDPTMDLTFEKITGINDSGEICAQCLYTPLNVQETVLLKLYVYWLGLASVSPNPIFATSKSGTTPINIVGVNFNSQSIVWWNNSPLSTQFISSTHLTAAVPNSYLANPVPDESITVQSTGLRTSNPLNLSIESTLSHLTPATVNNEVGAFTLTATGTHFLHGAQINFDGTLLVTSGTTTRLTATVPASLDSKNTSFQVSITNPDQSISNSLSFSITDPTPQISVLLPQTVPNLGEFTLTITGSGFTSNDVVDISSGTNLTPITITSTTITVQIPSSYVQQPGTVILSIYDPQSTYSNQAVLTVTSDQPMPIISDLEESSIFSGSPGFIYVNGTGFTSQSIVYFNSTPLTTSLETTDSLLGASIPESLIDTPGSAVITVINPAPGGGTSNAETLSFAAQTPYLYGLSASSTLAGTETFALDVYGYGFASNAVVSFSKTPSATILINYSTLSSTLPANIVNRPGKYAVTVANQGGTPSSSLMFTVITTHITASVESVAVDASGNYDVLVSVQNVGNLSAPNLTVSMTSGSFAPLNYPSGASLGTLAAGAATTITFVFSSTLGKPGGNPLATIRLKYTGFGSSETTHEHLLLP